ncbi:hypothetical protein BLNAU_11113 [Blattamonas nauphoetae]|uniref:Uncharacterized protein n=1 Tax=Blattamonas nauphoetae TaxID=2049346 RepID=A0ABQ9XSR9_9EUKA|nr:hypothetical protein BLNAU_11113 [Blattamonas nauphoetae]
MAVAGSVGKGSREEEKGREQANADCQPVIRLKMDTLVEMSWRRSSASLSDALVDDTATDFQLSPHSSPTPNPTGLEG